MAYRNRSKQQHEEDKIALLLWVREAQPSPSRSIEPRIQTQAWKHLAMDFVSPKHVTTPKVRVDNKEHCIGKYERTTMRLSATLRPFLATKQPLYTPTLFVPSAPFFVATTTFNAHQHHDLPSSITRRQPQRNTHRNTPLTNCLPHVTTHQKEKEREMSPFPLTTHQTLPLPIDN